MAQLPVEKMEPMAVLVQAARMVARVLAMTLLLGEKLEPTIARV